MLRLEGLCVGEDGGSGVAQVGVGGRERVPVPIYPGFLAHRAQQVALSCVIFVCLRLQLGVMNQLKVIEPDCRLLRRARPSDTVAPVTPLIGSLGIRGRATTRQLLLYC